MDWSDVLTSDADLMRPLSGVLSGGDEPRRDGRARAVKRVSALRNRFTAQNAPRAFRFETVLGTFDRKLNWDRTLGHNVGVYGAVVRPLW